MSVFIGIDPGASGALARFDSARNVVEIVDMPMAPFGLSRGLNHWGLADLLSRWADVSVSVVIERVSAMPGQGVVSMFTFGQYFGAVKQAVASAGIAYTLIEPRIWKRVYGLQGGRENKGASAAKAIELFPELKPLMYGPKGGVKDGRAEAVLLAHYGSKLQ